MKSQFATSLRELEKNMNDLISELVGSISRDLMELLEPEAPLLLSGKRSA
jgi:hypothetical protein